MVGRIIDHYEILSRLGEGGMGIVYKARDNHLGRLVALKILPADKTGNDERKQRFIREAMLASSLNHPNIVTIYDIGSQNGIDYMVMEYVAGKTLDQLIPRRGMRLSDALKVALQLADAIARAHGEGIVHRDLKPTNVMVTDDGLVKVLDFGLAKLTEASFSDEARTLPIRQSTEEGTILGTVAYMSPEQAEGKGLDTRSDIFAFGSLFYEMITAQRAFQGETRLSTLSAILRAEPRPIREVARAVPREVERVVLHCLRKDPGRRFQHMVDVKTLLAEIKEESDSGLLPVSRFPSASTRRLSWPLLSIVLLAVVFGSGYWFNKSRQASAERAVIHSFIQVTRDTGLTIQPTLSPDGKLVAYASDRAGNGRMDIWVQQITGGNALQITKEPGYYCQPVFSPDGDHIAYTALGEGGGVYISPTLGGPARLVGRGGAWPAYSPDGQTLAYSVGMRWRRSKIYLLREGASPRPLEVDLPWAFSPTWFPDGKRLFFEASSEADTRLVSDLDWWAASVDGGDATRTGLRGFLLNLKLRPSRELNPALDNRIFPLPDSQEVVLSAGRGSTSEIWRMALSENGRPAGRLEQLTSGPGRDWHPSITGGGLLAFSSVRTSQDIWRLPLDPNRGVVGGPLQLVTESRAEDTTPRISPDGRSLLYISGKGGETRVWIRNLVTGEDSQLTTTPGKEYRAVFSPDGSQVAICRGESGRGDLLLYHRGRRSEEMLIEGIHSVVDWFKDGTRVLYTPVKPPVVRSINVRTKETVDVLRHSTIGVRPARLSPDQRWISFFLAMDEESAPLFVAPLLDGVAGSESSWVRIADGPNDASWWSPNGELLYYLSRRDGFICVWAQRLKRLTKEPLGAPISIQHFHGRRHVEGGLGFGYGMGADSLYCGLREVTGNIWLRRSE
jgi:serine/threonine protein kinase/Tol biopolymer transport system component